jgi:hypothetical protein
MLISPHEGDERREKVEGSREDGTTMGNADAPKNSELK